jgi:hypothetical protein
MIGLDVEVFTRREGEETIIPAMLAMQNAGKVVRLEDVYKDIEGPDFDGYHSLEVVLATGRVTEDGAAMETPCNPGDSAKELMDNVLEPVLTCLEIAEANGAELVAAPLVWLDPEHLEFRNELRVLGCDPDQDIWRGDEFCEPDQDPLHTLWRTGGGHIHFSPSFVHRPDVQEHIVLWCDLILGTLDVILEHSDDGVSRREMYGQPGKHRLQAHGVEYRTMSNVWFTNPDVAKLVLDMAHLIHSLVESNLENGPWAIINKIGWTYIVEAITECKLQNAGKIFMYTMEMLESWGVNVEDNLDFPFISDLYGAGGVVGLYGDYNMQGWLE